MRIPTSLKVILLSCVLGYLLLWVMAIALASRFLFTPPKPSTYHHLKGMRMLPTRDGAIAKIVWMHPKSDRINTTLLFSHGNASDLGTSKTVLKALYAQGWNVISYDYNGYGLSQGKATQQHVYDDIQAVYADATQRLRIPAKHLVLAAHSLGTGPTIDLAGKKPAQAVVLISPYLSIYSTKLPWGLRPFPLDPFNNTTRIKKIHTPLLIAHGTRDAVIPFFHGKNAMRWPMHLKSSTPKKDGGIIMFTTRGYGMRCMIF
jgi:abhydrolase domain-containing protein 17